MEILLDEGYQFGLGVFTTVQVEQGIPILLAEHLERLCGSLSALGLSGTVTEAEVKAFLKGKDAQHHGLKIMVSEKNKLMTLRENPYGAKEIEKGFRLALSRVYRNETSPLVRHKTFNYGDCILEKRRARREGADEMVFTNSMGQLCEGTVSNVFFASGGKLYTPPVSCGLLPGVMRRFLMEHMEVTEQVLYMEDAARMEECFVTNSLMGIMPVTAFGEKIYQPGRATQKCRAMYENWISFCRTEKAAGGLIEK